MNNKLHKQGKYTKFNVVTQIFINEETNQDNWKYNTLFSRLLVSHVVSLWKIERENMKGKLLVMVGFVGDTHFVFRLLGKGRGRC